MFEISTFSAVLTIFSLIVVLLIYHFTYWARKGVKGPCRTELEGLISIVHNYLLVANKKYGRVYGTYFLFRKWIVVNEPQLIRDITTKDFHIFPDHYNMNMGSSKLQKAIFFLKGNDEWKRIRSVVTPAFTSGKLRAMMANISQITDRFVENLDNSVESGQSVDIRKNFGAFAMDVISTCAYGINIESINNQLNPIVVNAKKILGVDSTVSYALSVLVPSFARLIGMEPFDINAINYFDELTNKIVTERKNSTKNDSIKRSDFIQMMINNEKNDSDYDSISDEELKDSEGDRSKKSNWNLSNDELTAQGILFFIAGYDTTSAALSHALYFLAQNIECQQRLAEELRTLTEEFSYENLNQLKYLNAVINETLRMAPPLTCVQRECIEDYKLGATGITILKGTIVEIQPYVVHRDPEFFADPDQFKPERFLEPNHPPFAFIPFGGGPRLCVGMRFALNEMRMCIAKVITQFEFTISPGFKIDYFRGSILMTPKEVLVDIKRRQK